MNEAKPKELKKILNERHQNVEQGLQKNSDAQNSCQCNWFNNGFLVNQSSHYLWSYCGCCDFYT
ncbi:hypothetical protein [uncultured Campylobacter sp.]|uniref:hypothetical protein n=1 Tax=uncultured Campylobacter sp. TaxID=218934 RepID=UPI002615235D|nr:hypothetical protein [uncultured Campylobacter sp.]